jgi:hypothetical protein
VGDDPFSNTIDLFCRTLLSESVVLSLLISKSSDVVKMHIPGPHFRHSGSKSFRFLYLSYINNTRGFHCDNSIHVHSVP